MAHFARRITFLPKARTFATATKTSSFVAERQAIEEHAEGNNKNCEIAYSEMLATTQWVCTENEYAWY